MFKGLKALFASGVILHPMVLLGTLSGAVFVYKFDLETIISIFMYYDYYLVAFSVSFLYTIFFDMAYKSRGYRVDWKATFGKVVASSIKLIVSNVCSVLFFYFIVGI